MSGFLNSVLGYMIDQAAQELNKSGTSWDEAVKEATELIEAGLDLTSYETQPYTGGWYDQEIQGMADGSGVSKDTIRRCQMLGELTKGSCSMFGAWDEALATGEGLLTMRALDWITSGKARRRLERGC